MRTSSMQQLDQVRKDLSKYRSDQLDRQRTGYAALAEMEEFRDAFPRYFRGAQAASLVYLKAYREGAYLNQNERNDRSKQTILIGQEDVANIPDLNLARVEELVTMIKELTEKNLEAVGDFEESFEDSVAATLNQDIEKVAEEARISASQKE